MAKSKKRRHFMEDGQLELMRGIRKPMPPPSRIINPKDANKDRHWDWREALENEENEENPGV